MDNAEPVSRKKSACFPLRNPVNNGGFPFSAPFDVKHLNPSPVSTSFVRVSIITGSCQLRSLVDLLCAVPRLVRKKEGKVALNCTHSVMEWPSVSWNVQYGWLVHVLAQCPCRAHRWHWFLVGQYVDAVVVLLGLGA